MRYFPVSTPYLEVFHRLGRVRHYYDILSHDEIAIFIADERSLDSVEAAETYLIDCNYEALYARTPADFLSDHRDATLSTVCNG